MTCEKVYQSSIIFLYDQWTKNKLETTFNQFILLGFVGTEKVVAVFTYNQVESVELPRFWNKLQPGSAYAIIRPEFDQKFKGQSLQPLY